MSRSVVGALGPHLEREGFRSLTRFAFILAFALAVLWSGATVAEAQVGSLNTRTEFAMVYGPGLNGARAPLRAIVLWGGVPNWARPRNDADVRRIDSVMADAQRRAAADHRDAFGSGNAFAVQRSAPHQLIVEGITFDLTDEDEDSVLVIMVAVPATQHPRKVATVRLAAARAPIVDYTTERSKTGFALVPVPHATMVRLLETYLRESPMAATFIR